MQKKTQFLADRLRMKTLTDEQSAALQQFLFPADRDGSEFQREYKAWERQHPANVKPMTDAELDELVDLGLL